MEGGNVRVGKKTTPYASAALAYCSSKEEGDLGGGLKRCPVGTGCEYVLMYVWMEGGR